LGLKGACVLGRLAGNPVEGDEVEPVVVDDVVPSLGLSGLSGFKGPEEFPELPDELPDELLELNDIISLIASLGCFTYFD
jgi:hypothetical protein